MARTKKVIYDEEEDNDTELIEESEITDSEIEEIDDSEEEQTEIEDEQTETEIEEQSEEQTEVEQVVNNNESVKWHVVKNEERISDDFISVFEYVRCLCVRTVQIMRGSKIMLENGDELRKKYTPKQIAKFEIENKTCPLIIIRKMPNGNIERWSINELKILF